MSFGSLSPNAIRALNAGARRGGFYHETEEGGISPYHLEHSGDLVWRLESGYFGCRDGDKEEGNFDPARFEKQAALPSVKMIETRFHTPLELMEFIRSLRMLPRQTGRLQTVYWSSGGIHEHQAMLATKIYPDFIFVDGLEGDSGVASAEFSDHVDYSMPITGGHKNLYLKKERAVCKVRSGGCGKISRKF
jgi:glutamate synthase domain-containing protein 2